MKKYFGLFLGLMISLAVAVPVSAAPTKVLTRDILDKFLKDFPLVQVEMEALEDELADELSAFELEDAGFPTLESIQAGIMAVMLNPKVSSILARYGWTEAFMETYVVVMTGYSHIAFEEIYLAYPMPQIKEVLDQLQTGLHPDDLALLKQYRSRIEAVLDVDIGL